MALVMTNMSSEAPEATAAVWMSVSAPTVLATTCNER